MTLHALRFRRVLIAGIVVNAFLVFPVLFLPSDALELFRGIPGPTAVWPAVCGLILLLLTPLYVLPAVDPTRYRAIGGLFVIARVIGFVSFAFVARAYVLLGLVDCVLAVASAVFLRQTLRGAAAAPRSRGRTLPIGLAIFVIVLAVTVVVTLRFKLTREARDEPGVARARADFPLDAADDLRLPLLVWTVLPRMFTEYVPGPGGYQSFGFDWREGQPTPVGFSIEKIGYPRVSINCALCHAVRGPVDGTAWDPAPLPGSTARLEGYLQFLSDCADDPRFTAENVLGTIQYEIDLCVLDEMLYRNVIIPGARRMMLEQRNVPKLLDALHADLDRSE